MKKMLFVLSCLTLFITVDVKALGVLPAIITSSDNKSVQSIEFLSGEYVLPEFCSVFGCTISVDIFSLKAIGKYQFDSREEYFHIISGDGATIYELGGTNASAKDVYDNNYNKIVIDANKIIESGSVTIGMGGGNESRTVKLIPTKITTEPSNPVVEPNDPVIEPTTPVIGDTITGTDISVITPTDNVTETDDIITGIDDVPSTDIIIDEPNVEKPNTTNKTKKNFDQKTIIYIFVGVGFLGIIASSLLLTLRKKKLSD